MIDIINPLPISAVDKDIRRVQHGNSVLLSVQGRKIDVYVDKSSQCTHPETIIGWDVKADHDNDGKKIVNEHHYCLSCGRKVI